MEHLTCDNCRFTRVTKEECGAHHERWSGRPRQCKVLDIQYGKNSCHIDGEGYIDNRNKFGVLDRCPRKELDEAECLTIVKVGEIKFIRGKIDTNNDKVQRLVIENDDLIDQLIIRLEEE